MHCKLKLPSTFRVQPLLRIIILYFLQNLDMFLLYDMFRFLTKKWFIDQKLIINLPKIGKVENSHKENHLP
jgi:hypothetical protein